MSIFGANFMNNDCRISFDTLIEIFIDDELVERGSNSIHARNMLDLIGRMMSSFSNTTGADGIFEMRLGSGGIFITSTNTEIKKNPNVWYTSANLYNHIHTLPLSHAESVTNPNVVSYFIPPGVETRTMTVTCVSTIEPNTPYSVNNSSNLSTFVIDELGLFDKNGNMLTHYICNQRITKDANKRCVITYTLTLTV